MKDITQKAAKMKIEGKKVDPERKPTMRKKSMKKVKMTDEQIMAALSMYSIS